MVVVAKFHSMTLPPAVAFIVIAVGAVAAVSGMHMSIITVIIHQGLVFAAQQ